MKTPVDHILRPQLPWRVGEPGMTECGYDASKVNTLTRDEYFQRRKDLGEQRCAMMICMTCSQTAGRHGTWEDDPRLAIMREIQWEAPGWRYQKDRNGIRLRDELLSIASLVKDHRDEFLYHIAAQQRQREWLEKKNELKHSKKVKTVTRLKPL